VTHVAGLAAAETARMAEELRAGLDVPSGPGAEGRLAAWKSASSLVAVPFLLSPRAGVLVPHSAGRLSAEERKFLDENGEFLSNRAPTAVFENIAVRYSEQVLAEAEAKKGTAAAADRAVAALPPASAPQASLKDKPLRAAGAGPAADQAAATAPSGPAPAAPAPAERSLSAPSTAAAESRAGDVRDSASLIARREAIDTFAQSEEIQSRVYEQAKEKGDILNTRVVEPLAKASKAEQAPLPEPDQPSAPPQAQGQQSQFVVTSQLLGEIASQGEYGIIPRLIGSRLTFLFWEKQADGRIAGCGIAESAFRGRIAAALPPTYTPARLLTILDETGAPLVEPPGYEGRSWRRPFVAREIGESLPRWEAAAVLTDPGAVAARARRASAVIWVLALILFVSVAGGGTMVLSAVYSEVRLARKKSTFVTNVSHELKTPLTSISLFVEMLRQKRQADPAKQQQYLALVASETERLTRLINNVLDFSSIDKGKKQYAMRPMDLAEAAREIVESQRVRLESRGFAVSFKPPTGGAAEVQGDPEALKQVVLNLLSNAEKYSPAVKSIEVEVSREADGVAVHVRDRGIGVAEKDRQKIFREFYRVDDSLTTRVQGTGLGLTIARRIARAHAGDVVHEPREAGGSDFVLRLPAPSAPQAGEKG
jgi:signal transduction histidine kinase